MGIQRRSLHMAMIVFHTQYMENYGAHAWDGKGECPQNWKCKGGDCFVIRNLTPQQIKSYEKTGPVNLRKYIEYSNDDSREYICSDTIVEDGEILWDKWETPWELTYTKKIGWVAFRYVPRDEYWQEGVTGKTESYTLGVGGKRINYVCVYHTE